MNEFLTRREKGRETTVLSQGLAVVGAGLKIRSKNFKNDRVDRVKRESESESPGQSVNQSISSVNSSVVQSLSYSDNDYVVRLGETKCQKLKSGLQNGWQTK